MNRASFSTRACGSHFFARTIRSTRRQNERSNSLRGAAILIPEYVLVEVATALKRKGYEDAAKKFVAETMKDGHNAFLPVGELASLFAAAFLERNDTLSFTDTALLVLSERYRIISFDKRLHKAIERSRA